MSLRKGLESQLEKCCYVLVRIRWRRSEEIMTMNCKHTRTSGLCFGMLSNFLFTILIRCNTVLITKKQLVLYKLVNNSHTQNATKSGTSMLAITHERYIERIEGGPRILIAQVFCFFLTSTRTILNEELQNMGKLFPTSMQRTTASRGVTLVSGTFSSGGLHHVDHVIVEDVPGIVRTFEGECCHFIKQGNE